MESSRYFERMVCGMFDSYLKTCLSNEACNIENAQKKLDENEVLFADLPSWYVEELAVNIEKELLAERFQALHYTISIENDSLSEALRRLPDQKRMIILLHYFLDMTDMEIGALTHLQRERIKKTRQRTLSELRKSMEDTHD